jgi:predicted O-linked N-acetylglucosamine transferase (SPINDLY family)
MRTSLTLADQHRRAGLQALREQAWTRAVDEFESAVRMAPHVTLMWLNFAQAQLAVGRVGPALQSALQAVDTDGDNPLARRMLAACLLRQGRAEEAADAMDGLPCDVPCDAAWHREHGDALYQAGRRDGAVTAYTKALSLNGNDVLAHYRLGLCLRELNRPAAAAHSLRQAVMLGDADARAAALGLLVHQSRQACAWDMVDVDSRQMLAAMERLDPTHGHLIAPFSLLALDTTPAQQRLAGALRSQALVRGVQPLPDPAAAGPRRPGRIRLGYLSCDFRHHATSALMAEMLELRDTESFEVILYSHGPSDDSAEGGRVGAACDRFVDVSALDNEAVARLMRDDGIDIAIDLKGHTHNSRFEILAWRPAPLQVAFLGYPGTTGSDFIDYMIGDPVVLPLEHAEEFSECIAQLPHSYQPNDRQRPLLPAPSRASLGLPQGKVVLCCFNQSYKISSTMLDLWARILLDAPDAVLWLLDWNGDARANISREFSNRGIPADRLFWAPHLSMEEHIARSRQADLFLDTSPCNAHTTASEALWAGVPVITWPGSTFASRVAASLVKACGLPDLVCGDAQRYVALATALALQPQVLQHLKAQLEAHRMSLPLFDTPRYVRDYEALLRRMFDRQQAGLRPGHLPAGS